MARFQLIVDQSKADWKPAKQARKEHSGNEEYLRPIRRERAPRNTGPIDDTNVGRSFGTTCHGAGRAMSRTAAMKAARGRRIDRELAEAGVVVRARSLRSLAEEQPAAYKNVDEVVEVVHRAGLSRKVARMRPIGVIKG